MMILYPFPIVQLNVFPLLEVFHVGDVTAYFATASALILRFPFSEIKTIGIDPMIQWQSFYSKLFTIKN